MSSHKTIIHIDGDAFFASVYQATHAHAQGKPVVIGQERGIATAFSYEAKRQGVKRGMMISEVKKICPEALIVMSDYRMYQVFSNKIVSIAESFSPYVERYSIDEVFIDMTGFDRVHNMTYETIGKTLKYRIEQSLGLTVSVGIAQTKTLTKIASNAHKPSGFLVLTNDNINEYLHKTEVGDIWGIGYRLTKRMHMLGIRTAYDFYSAPEELLRSKFNKSVMQTWYELHGESLIGMSYGKKIEYKSIRKSNTVTPATQDKELLFARIMRHVEKAFVKARKHGYRVGHVDLFLKTQAFTYATTTIKFKERIAYPYMVREAIREAFEQIYKHGVLYRATGCTLYNFEDSAIRQQKLFPTDELIERRLEKIYPLYENHTITFGSDLLETRTFSRKRLLKTMSFDT